MNLKRDTRCIGFVKVMSGEYEEAIKEFDRGFEESPGTPDTLYFKGVAILSLKKRAEGGRRISVVERAWRDSPDRHARASNRR